MSKFLVATLSYNPTDYACRVESLLGKSLGISLSEPIEDEFESNLEEAGKNDKAKAVVSYRNSSI